MSFYTVSYSEDQIQDRTESAYITKSGIYEILLKHVMVSRSDNGSETIDLNFEYNGQIQTIWSAIRMTNNNGSPNFEQSLFNKMCICCDANEGQEISDPVNVELPVGKNGEMKSCKELQDFQDQPILMRVQMEYSKYNGEIKEKKKIKNFFRITDKATAQEIVNKAEFGKQYIEEEKCKDDITYRDEITADDVAAWKKEQAELRKSGSTAKSSSTNTNGFKRHSFGRPSTATTTNSSISDAPF